eukprot:TRINITY_DN2376_c0_g1_i1.p1 TRINITY_DN2376_c0_g1~~TRINITY_DN2376_c0_g1_i1.p1  ORF type:complete len:599 (-),score=88.67 TRINITY_DN2376_c0_g1_i1:1219-3015(-)
MDVQFLKLYRHALRISKRWTPKYRGSSEIANLRELFRRNKAVSDAAAESRLKQGQHLLKLATSLPPKGKFVERDYPVHAALDAYGQIFRLLPPPKGIFEPLISLCRSRVPQLIPGVVLPLWNGMKHHRSLLLSQFLPLAEIASETRDASALQVLMQEWIRNCHSGNFKSQSIAALFITAFAKVGDEANTLKAYSTLCGLTTASEAVCVACIKALHQLRSVHLAQLYVEMMTSPVICASSRVFSAYVEAAVELKIPELTERLFCQLPSGVATPQATQQLFTLFLRTKRSDLAANLLQQIKGNRPEQFVSVMKALYQEGRSVSFAEALYQHAMRTGCASVELDAAYVAVHGRVSAVAAEKALETVGAQKSGPDALVLRASMHSFVQHSSEKAFEAYDQIIAAGTKPDAAILTDLLIASRNAKQFGRLSYIWTTITSHKVTISKWFVGQIIAAAAEANDPLLLKTILHSGVPISPDSALILARGLIQGNDLTSAMEAVELFQRISPDPCSDVLLELLDRSTDPTSIANLEKCYRTAKQWSDFRVINGLVRAYARYNLVEHAQKVVNDEQQLNHAVDVSTWAELARGFVKSGQQAAATEITS